MTMLQIIIREIKYRKLNFLLSVLAIVMAVVLFVSFFTTGQASKRETIRLMRNMGFNIRIIPGISDMNKFWSNGFSEHTMPEEYVYRLGSRESISYNHLSATLQKKVSWQDREVILTGILPEISPLNKKKPPMSFAIEPGNIYLGFELAQSLDLKKGYSAMIFGEKFTIEQCLHETGTDDDIRIFGHLRDIQRILNLDGRINEIKALECVCYIPGVDQLDNLRREIAGILPDTRVIQIRSIASAREKQRVMADRYFSFILPLVFAVCIVWAGALAMINVHERQQEIGIMRALGYRSGKIAALFLGKAVVIGVIGAIIGFCIGTWLSLLLGPNIFQVTAHMITPVFSLLFWSLAAAPFFSAVSSFIPAMVAVTHDPADLLREI